MNADQQNLSQEIMSRIVALERFTRRIPSRFPAPAAPLSILWRVIGGNTLLTLGTPGINRRSDTVMGGEMPAGTGGASGDIVTMPASAIVPVGLPDGVGVAQSLNNGSFAWLILDNTGSVLLPSVNLAVPPLSVNEATAVLTATRVLDRVQGGVTYRYTCLIPLPGKW